MSAVNSKFVGYRGVRHRFAIYEKRKADGVVWFAAHDAEAISDAEFRKGKMAPRARIGADFQSLANWCDRQI